MQTDNQKLLGEIFTANREKLGLTISEISERLAIKKEVLEGFEQNKFVFDSIPSIFIQGFARRYGVFLGLDDNFLAPYNHLFGDNTQNDFYKNTRVKRMVNSYSNHNHWVVYLSWIIVIGSIILAGVWWWQSYQENQDNRQSFVENFQKENDSTAPDKLTIASSNTNLDEDKLVTDHVESDSAESKAITEVSSIKDDEVVDDNANASDISENSQKQVAVNSNLPDQITSLEQDIDKEKVDQIENDDNKIDDKAVTEVSQNLEKQVAVDSPKAVYDEHLAIAFNGACWISVRDQDGKILTEKEYGKGDKIEFSGKAPYSLRIGAPSQVEILYNGEPVKLKIDGRVAKIKLP